MKGINAREHAVFQELIRVKQYLQKVKGVEDRDKERGTASLDKDAAGRIIKHALVNQSTPQADAKLTRGLGWERSARQRSSFATWEYNRWSPCQIRFIVQKTKN